MKHITLLFVMLFNLTAGAAEEGRSPECFDGSCARKNSKSLTTEDIRKFVTALGVEKVTQGGKEITKILNDMNVGVDRACSKFVKEDEFQKWGEFVSQEFDRGKYKYLYAGTPDLLRLCPNFPQMTDDQKDSVFILKSTLHAFFESSCNPANELRSAPNGTAAGLFQLHKGKENRYSSGCKAGDSKNPEGSIRCTLAMLDDIAYNGKNIFSFDSHWAVNRPQDRGRKAGFGKNAALSTMEAICKIPSCKATPSDCKQFIEETRLLAIEQSRQKQSQKRVAQR